VRQIIDMSRLPNQSPEPTADTASGLRLSGFGTFTFKRLFSSHAGKIDQTSWTPIAGNN
jgi:hypothetical protein